MRQILQKTLMVGSIVACVLTGGFLAAQDQPAGGEQGAQRQDRRDRGNQQNGRAQQNGGGQFDPARMQEMMVQRLQERLAASDEEWTAIKPALEEVVKVQNKMRMGMMGGRRGGRGGDDAARSQQNPELAALVAAADSDTASSEELQSKLKAYREAQKRDAEELATAREKLRKLLTVRQEARLVTAGVLD